MSKNIPTKLTIQNLTTELKKTFAKKTDLTPISNAVAAAFKSGKVTGNTVELFTSTDQTGTAAFSFDFPTEYFLDQTKSQFVQNFAFDEETYPGATDPGLDGKPVMVLAVKAEGGTEITYSFVDLTYLLNTYKPADGDGSATVTVDGYNISVNVNVSPDADNALVKKEDGSLFVAKAAVVDISGKADKDADATEGNVAIFDAEGNPVDGGMASTDLVLSSDISDYSAEEIAAMLADDDVDVDDDEETAD